MKPEFATNRGDERVGDAIRGHLEYILDTWQSPPEVGIATAYFNPEGFELLADPLEKVSHVRLLLGAEPDSRPRAIRQLSQEASPQQEERVRVWRALEGHQRGIEQDRDLLGFELEADGRARRLIEFLKSDRIEVRRFEQGFLHGKAFLVTTDDEGVIAGSSNFTAGGLMHNLELNLGHYQPHVVGRVREWFNELWEEAVPFDLAAIYEARYEPHNPYTIYLRMLLERYGREIEEEFGDAKIHLTSFQQDGLWRAWRILQRHHGVVVADGVGLGKTFLAGEMIRQVVQERRQRVLLVSPASLRDGPWRHFLAEHQLGVESISYEQLSEDRQANPAEGTSRHIQFPLDQYAMVVIDEAHAYRNPDTQRAQVLRRLLQGTPPKDLVLLTATPVNNSLWDLYYLLSYFIRNDSQFASAGIRSLRDHFGESMKVDPDDLSPDRLFDILDDVAVRRTRHFVKRFYPNDRLELDGQLVPITFPKPQVHKVTYDLEDVLPGFFPKFAHALDCVDGCEHPEPVKSGRVLHLARYIPSHFSKRGATEAYELQVAGLLRSALLKRFESSAYAFTRTCETMVRSHDAFLEMLAKGHVATGVALKEWVSSDSPDVDDVIERFGDHVEPADGYRVEDLRKAVEADREVLLRFAAEANEVTPDRDPKLSLLAEELAKIAAQAEEEGFAEEDTREKRKVIVFTYFADTVEWIREFLEAGLRSDPKLVAYRDRMTALSGTKGDRADALYGFAPRTTNAPPGSDEDRYDLLVSTDVLAEGVNLQQARHIINYDLPWNPMRLVQRHGRIDRIGSPHDKVWIRCVFPDEQLDDLLGLEARLQRKLTQAAAAVGVEDEVLPGSAKADVTFADTHAEIERLRGEDPELFEIAGERGHAYSGEEYRQELRAGLENPDIERAVRSLPWGSGSGLAREGGREGWVFCCRVASHEEPVFRYVWREGGGWQVAGETLTCLAAAHATSDTERVLGEESHRLAYDAWAVARGHIFEEWDQATDPANLTPSVPKAMREAAAILRTNPPAGRTQEEVDGLVDAIEAPYGPRILAMMRDAIRSSDDPGEQAENIAQTATELGLRPSPAAEPLPVIVPEDVHLVCWMAIVPKGAA
jgi:hypothetical protein